MNTSDTGLAKGDRVAFAHVSRVKRQPMSDLQRKHITEFISKTMPHLPRKMYSTNEHNTICFASNLRSSPEDAVNKSKVVPRGGSSTFPCPCPSPPGGEFDAAGDSCAAKKLKIRGLRNFVEKRGCGVPPMWVKEFPCRSRYHPDMYLYNFDEGPFNPKRNVEALNKCQYKGGRCRKCGIYGKSICPSCDYCEVDCECPDVGQHPPCPAEGFNPFGTMPSADSFATTLNTAQRILASSQNAPRHYPFNTVSMAKGCPPSMPSTTSALPNIQQFAPSPPSYPYLPPYPYAYPPPLPYMMPPPPVYGYSYMPPPMQIAPMMPPGPSMYYPGAQHQQYPDVNPGLVQPSARPPITCKTTYSVNNNESF